MAGYISSGSLWLALAGAEVQSDERWDGVRLAHPEAYIQAILRPTSDLFLNKKKHLILQYRKIVFMGLIKGWSRILIRTEFVHN